VGSLKSHNPIGLHGLLREWPYLFAVLLSCVHLSPTKLAQVTTVLICVLAVPLSNLGWALLGFLQSLQMNAGVVPRNRPFTGCFHMLRNASPHCHNIRFWVRVKIASLIYKEISWPDSTNELYRPNDRRFSAKLVSTFADRRSHVVSMTVPYGRILAFLDRRRYFFFEVAPQLYSRGWVVPVPDPLLR
jgi:hypothetical protein